MRFVFKNKEPASWSEAGSVIRLLICLHHTSLGRGNNNHHHNHRNDCAVDDHFIV
jgi:hypothetical protein